MIVVFYIHTDRIPVLLETRADDREHARDNNITNMAANGLDSDVPMDTKYQSSSEADDNSNRPGHLGGNLDVPSSSANNSSSSRTELVTDKHRGGDYRSTELAENAGPNTR